MQIHADMAGADGARLDKLVPRQRQQRRWVAGTVRAGSVERVDQRQRRAFGRQCRVDLQAFLVMQAENLGRRLRLEEGAQRAEP